MESKFSGVFKPKPINLESKTASFQPNSTGLESMFYQMLHSNPTGFKHPTVGPFLNPQLHPNLPLPNLSLLPFFQTMLNTPPMNFPPFPSFLAQQSLLLGLGSTPLSEASKSLLNNLPGSYESYDEKPETSKSQPEKKKTKQKKRPYTSSKSEKTPLGEKFESNSRLSVDRSSKLSVDQKLDLIFNLKPKTSFGFEKIDFEEPSLMKKVKQEMPKIDISEEDVAGFNALRELALKQKAQQGEWDGYDRTEVVPVYFKTEDGGNDENDYSSQNSSTRLPFEKLASVSTDFSSEISLKRDESLVCQQPAGASKLEE